MKKRNSTEMIPKSVVHAERLFYRDMIQALQTSQSRWFGNTMRTLCAKQEVSSVLQASLGLNILLSLGMIRAIAIVDTPLLGKIFFGLVFGSIGIVAAMLLLGIVRMGK